MKEMICTSPFFGITLSIIAYSIGCFINRKTRLALLNPLLISYILIIPSLLLFDIPLEWYDEGGDIINMFLSPATAVLAITIYRQRDILRKHIAAVLAGSLAGSASSILIVFVLCRALGLDDTIMASLLPKSITTPMAIAVSESLGGIQAITVLSVIVTGILGSIIGPVMIRLFRIRSEIAQGMAMGAASHAVGTSKAIERAWRDTGCPLLNRPCHVRDNNGGTVTADLRMTRRTNITDTEESSHQPYQEDFSARIRPLIYILGASPHLLYIRRYNYLRLSYGILSHSKRHHCTHCKGKASGIDDPDSQKNPLGRIQQRAYCIRHFQYNQADLTGPSPREW